MNARLNDYLRERPMLLRIAYKILGSQSEAEDILQDLYMKIMAQKAVEIQNPRAWMIRLVVNAAIDQKRGFYRQKVDYIGSWLPEPFVEAEKSEREVKDDVSMAFMVLLERLNPIERAVFVLRETCEFPYQDIAVILGMTEAACRKSWQRAEAALKQGRKRYAADPKTLESMTMAFLQYWAQGQSKELIQLLQAEAVLYSDGGGKVSATAAPIAGAARIIKFLFSLLRAAGPNAQASVKFLPPDQACLMVDGKLVTLICVETDGACIHNLYFVRNPDKLSRIRAQVEV